MISAMLLGRGGVVCHNSAKKLSHLYFAESCDQTDHRFSIPCG